MPTNPQPQHPKPPSRRPAARDLLLLPAIALALLIAPTTATARPPAAPTEAQLSQARLLAPGSGYNTPHGSTSVRALQLRLTALDTAPGPIDGRYGPLTAHAVERFQTARRLTADGIAGPHTLAELTTPGLYPEARKRPPTERVVYRRPAPQRAPRPSEQAAQASKTTNSPSQLPVTPVLLGLLALGLATATLTYTHARRTRTKTRPPTTLQIKPIHQPPGRQPPIARHGANHPERQP
jgi:peptidoglycan hydrolase-like protein with peptidoglycan-binding domain